MDVLKVVQQLRDLTADPQNRATIVRDQGCLPGLVIFLDNDNPQVVLTALEALHYLAQVPSNRPLMKSEVGLLISIRRIISRQHTRPDVKSSAQRVHDLLIPPAGATRFLTTLVAFMGVVVGGSTLHVTQNHKSAWQRVPTWQFKLVANIVVAAMVFIVVQIRPLSQSRSSVRGSNVFLGASNKRAKLVVLHIDNLKDQESRKLVEDTLLGVKGVISFTFNMPQKRCIVRVRTDIKPEVPCRALEATGALTVKHIIKNENGEEMLLSYGPSSEAAVQDEKENTKPPKLPDYLPEYDPHAAVDSDTAIEKSGAVGGGGGWFSSVSSFLANNFYW